MWLAKCKLTGFHRSDDLSMVHVTDWDTTNNGRQITLCGKSVGDFAEANAQVTCLACLVKVVDMEQTLDPKATVLHS
jgi:hypothetical protein